MTRDDHIINAMLVAYILGGFLTGAYWANRNTQDEVGHNMTICAVAAVWPFYWLGRASLAITEPVKTLGVEK